MISDTAAVPRAAEAYNALAPAYDLLTRDYDYARWLPALEQLALARGLNGRHVLDVACGTGESFLPLLERGYQVTGCDVSEGMLARAEEKAPGVELRLLDMRALPVLGTFDLITCIDDALNYLLDERELEATFRGFARNLAPGGVAVWDLNTLAQYQNQFASDHVVADDGLFIGWRGSGRGHDLAPGAQIDIGIDVFANDGDGSWRRSTGVHRQRHWPRELVEMLCSDAGLEVVDVRGQHPGVVIEPHLNELIHTKAIYLARPKGAFMDIGGP